MKSWIKVLVVTLVVGVPAFLLEPSGPFGAFWAPTPQLPPPTGAQLPLFMLLGLLEALSFGLGVAFLLFGYPLVRAAAGSRRLSWAAYLAVGWFLVNWWPHDSLHQHVGLELSGC